MTIFSWQKVVFVYNKSVQQQNDRIFFLQDLYAQGRSNAGVMFASIPNFLSDFYSEDVNEGMECIRLLNEIIGGVYYLYHDMCQRKCESCHTYQIISKLLTLSQMVPFHFRDSPPAFEICFFFTCLSKSRLWLVVYISVFDPIGNKTAVTTETRKNSSLLLPPSRVFVATFLLPPSL